MIPDFPKVKEKLKSSLNILMKQEMVKKSPLLSLMALRQVYEGDKMGILREDGKHEVNHFNEVSSEASISAEQMQGLSSGDMQNIFSDISTNMASQVEKGIMQSIEKGAADGGNEIAIPKIDQNLILESMKSIKIYFHNDDRNKPSEQAIITEYPAVFEILKKIKGKQTQEEKEEFERRREEILDEKYKEHMSDLESRKMVD